MKAPVCVVQHGEGTEQKPETGTVGTVFPGPFRKDAAFWLTIGSFLLTVELFHLQLTILAFLLTIGAFSLTILAYLLAVGAFLLTMGKCV